jgi:RNA 3'-terminal phosphate cyclase (ATP)
MIEIDGSRGEGGGQILRTALALSMITGMSFRMVNIRAKRSKPGLLRQHLTCVEASREISTAQVDGASIGSTEITFRPGKVKSGDYVFKTGGAGSTTLVLQTVLLPLALRGGGASTIQFEGGTHNPMAPPVDYLEHVYLPALARMGLICSVKFDAYGFYPAGGGRWAISVPPLAQAKHVEFIDRGALVEAKATALIAKIPKNVGHRELFAIRAHLPMLLEANCQVAEAASIGPGNVLCVGLQFEHANERLYAFGERGVSSEHVAEQVANEVKTFLKHEVPVGEHLADQLLLPFALGAGGVFRTVKPSQHFVTQTETIARFLPASVHVLDEETGRYLVTVVATNGVS